MHTTSSADAAHAARLFRPGKTARLAAAALSFVGAGLIARAQSYLTQYTPALGPTGMALDTVAGHTYLFLADEPHGQVLKIDTANGATVATFGTGSQGTAPGQFGRPYGLAIDPVSHDLYVTERLNGRVQRVNSTTGASVMMWGTNDAAFNSTGQNTNSPNPTSPQGHFQEPIGVAVDANGNVYVVDHGNNRVQKFLVHQVNGVWTADNVAMWGTTGAATGQFDHPYGAALDAAGNLWVADGLNGRVQEFDSTGKYLATVGSKGTSTGQFVIATWVNFDAAGALYVTSTNSDPQNGSAADASSQWVSKFTPGAGGATFVSRFGGAFGSGPGQFELPFDAVIDAASHAYVSDYYNSRVQVFDLNGAATSGGATSGTSSGGTTGSGTSTGTTTTGTSTGSTSGTGSGSSTGTTSGTGSGSSTGTTSGTGSGTSTGTTSTGGTSNSGGASSTVVKATVPANGTYRAGDALVFTVTFNTPVTLSGASSKDDESDDADDASAGISWSAVGGGDAGTAVYVSGSGSSTLTFKYQVHGNDTAPQGIQLGTTIGLSGGATLKTKAGQTLTAAQLTLAWPQNPLPGVILVPANMSNHGAEVSGRSGSGTASAGSVITGTGSGTSTTSVDAGKGGGKSARLINLSSRLRVSSGDAAHTVTVGFVVSGSASQTVLVRAVGPGLRGFGVADALSDPTLTIQNSAGATVASNSGWANDPAILAAGDHVGAFRLGADGHDAALIANLAPGAYTATVTSAKGNGEVLIEVYDTTSGVLVVGTPQLVNVSTRGFIDAGGNLIVGFVVRGDAPQRVLVRAVGPTLAKFGVSGALADPQLQVIDGSNATVARNDDWGTPVSVDASHPAATAAEISAANATAGAFPLTAGAKDSAVVVTLAPGAYSAVVSGAASASGAVLVEVYELPSP